LFFAEVVTLKKEGTEHPFVAFFFLEKKIKKRT